jgi:hypothetical protein
VVPTKEVNSEWMAAKRAQSLIRSSPLVMG